MITRLRSGSNTPTCDTARTNVKARRICASELSLCSSITPLIIEKSDKQCCCFSNIYITYGRGKILYSKLPQQHLICSGRTMPSPTVAVAVAVASQVVVAAPKLSKAMLDLPFTPFLQHRTTKTRSDLICCTFPSN